MSSDSKSNEDLESLIVKALGELESHSSALRQFVYPEMTKEEKNKRNRRKRMRKALK